MHLMLDFETLGSAATTCAVSLGAVAFNREGIIAEASYEFNLDEQARLGRTFTGDTLAWWMRQSETARAVFNSKEPKLKMAEFFEAFEAFIDNAARKVGEKRDQLKPWGKGSNFDISILEDMYRTQNREMPWKFWNVRCYRTFAELTKCEERVNRPHGTHHTAVEDARYQAQCVLAQMNKRKTK